PVTDEVVQRRAGLDEVVAPVRLSHVDELALIVAVGVAPRDVQREAARDLLDVRSVDRLVVRERGDDRIREVVAVAPHDAAETAGEEPATTRLSMVGRSVNDTSAYVLPQNPLVEKPPE